MSTELDLDISALVGEMEAPPCDSESHYAHVDGPAVSYARIRCCACGLNGIRAYCADMVAWILGDGILECCCGRMDYAGNCASILGPVKA